MQILLRCQLRVSLADHIINFLFKLANPLPLKYFLVMLPFLVPSSESWGFPGGSDGKESVHNVGNLGSVPGLGRFPGEGNGNPL